METTKEKWEKIHQRIMQLNNADETEESELLSEAYELLIEAYQEARELNSEMEELLMECYA